ncbi:MAG TPA: ABC transporter permease subunit [Polyangiaceae bacterium]|jgi:ABC-type dipeptide/oligopeptide/nickel transport system permease component
MFRYALRRTLWAIPTLIAISLVVFAVTSLLPDPAADLPWHAASIFERDPVKYDALEEQRRQRYLDLPAFFHSSPNDVRQRAEQAVRHIAADDASAPLAAHGLARLGGAALPYVLPELDHLAPVVRGRVAMALTPIAVRMGLASEDDLADRNDAVVFWTRFWEDRALDFTPPALRRAVHRLALHASDARERDLALVDTYALSAVIPAMEETTDRDAIRALAALATHCTDHRGEIAPDADDETFHRVVNGWQAWWQVHESDYVAYDGVARIAATVLDTRYGKWILGAVTGRLGMSSVDGQPIADKLRAKTPVTLLLTALALLASYAIAVPLGALAAWWRGRPVDTVLAIVLFAMYSLPTFWAAQLLAHAYTVPPPAHAPEALDVLHHVPAAWKPLAIPVLALMVGSLATLSRYQRAATLETSGLEYVRTAKAKGASAARQLIVHALRNAMLPTVTLAGLQFPALLGGAFVVEEVFAVPGIGYETIRAVEAHDTAWLVSVALVTAVVTTIALIASDVALGLLDPRVREDTGAPRGGEA